VEEHAQLLRSAGYIVDAEPLDAQVMRVLQQGDPPGAIIIDLTLWFVRALAELEEGIRGMGQHAHKGRLWILWPKKASGVPTDLAQATVRRTGLAAGLADLGLCAGCHLDGPALLACAPSRCCAARGGPALVTRPWRLLRGTSWPVRL
jgi:hypothetical protein